MIWVTSDLHLAHNKEFLYKPRGFDSVEAMNEAVLKNWNNRVSNDDEVYCLGDLVLSNTEKGIELIKQLNGKIHIIRGNHDSDNRIILYKELPNVVEVVDAKYLKYNGYRFFMTHYPCMTDTLQNYGGLKNCLCNLYGHTHQKTNFYNEIPFIYHVGMDSHNCTPVSIDEVIRDMEAKVEELVSIE